MAVVIGSATSVVFGSGTSSSSSVCVISAQWGYSPNNQDAFCLDGVGDPITNRAVFKPEKTLSLTVYAPGPTYLTPLTKNCTTAVSTLSATVTPGLCSGTGGGVTDTGWVVTAYSYSKETKDSTAQESWSLVKYLGFGVGNITSLVAPTAVLRVSAQGQSSEGSSTGIVFSTILPVAATAGSISVGSLGKADTMTIGTVSQVGGGGGVTTTPAGTGSAQMAYNPVYV